MIPEVAGYITRRESQKLLRLEEKADDSRIDNSLLRKREKLSLYVHIPFCRKLCPFCWFNRYVFEEDKAREYFVNLKKELDLYIQRGFCFSNFYFGGGTPTILMDELLGFIDYLRHRFTIREISLETTPNELTPEKIALLKSVGIGRLSLGVQSFDDGVLRIMGRSTCTGQEIKEKVLQAQGQFSTVNIDLIYNFPFQTSRKFKQDIETIKELGIDQVTFYPLMPFPREKILGSKFAHVDNSRERNYYDIILRDVYHQGYHASTVWCFSKGDHMIDEYIIDYPDYVGIGSGTVSLINGIFYVNSFSLEKYANKLKHDQLPIVLRRNLSPNEYFRYYLLTRLFGTKVDKNQFYRRFQTSISQKLGWELRLLKLAGAVIENKNEIRVTPEGMYTVSVMMRQFFASLNSLRKRCIEGQV